MTDIFTQLEYALTEYAQRLPELERQEARAYFFKHRAQTHEERQQREELQQKLHTDLLDARKWLAEKRQQIANLPPVTKGM